MSEDSWPFWEVLLADLGRLGHPDVQRDHALTLVREALYRDWMFRTGLEHARVSVFTQDTELRYTWMFKSFGTVPGNDFLGHTDAEMLPPEAIAPITELKRQVLATGEVMRQQIEIDCGGELLSLDLTLAPLRNPSGAVTGLVGVAVDVSQEEHARRVAISGRDRAEAQSRAKSESLARASHDLRQPFQAMKLYYEVLAPQLADPTQRKVADRLKAAMDSAERLLTSVLDLSRLEGGTVRIALRDFPLQDVFDELGRELAVQAAQKDLKLRVVPTSAWACSDRLMLTRLLRNLLHNAIRYTRRGGVLMGARRAGNDVRIEVWDTGVGIADDQQHRIFDDFYRIGGDEGEGGLGLGLATVSRIARVLGLEVAVHSTESKGSVFAVTVPRPLA